MKEFAYKLFDAGVSIAVAKDELNASYQWTFTLPDTTTMNVSAEDFEKALDAFRDAMVDVHLVQVKDTAAAVAAGKGVIG